MPGNAVRLYAPFQDELFLLTTVIKPEPEDKDFLAVSWPVWFMRMLADRHDFKFNINLEHNQSKLQFIMAALLEYAEKGYSLEQKNYVLTLAQRSIDQGADVDNVANYGLSALHEVVLSNNLELAKFLMKNGASCDALIARPGKPINGMDALGLAEYLASKNNLDRSELIAYLKSLACTTQATINGLWQNTREAGTIEFKPGGKVIIVDNLSATVVGSYKIEDNNLLKLELIASNIFRDSVQPDPKTIVTAKIIKLKGDELQLIPAGEVEVESYRRIR